MTTLEALLKVQALIGDPKHPERWTKGDAALSRDRVGNMVFPRSRNAKSWTLKGAIEKVLGDNTVPFWTLVDIFIHQIPAGSSLSSFNNFPLTTHADICALIQRAIDAERTKEVA